MCTLNKIPVPTSKCNWIYGDSKVGEIMPDSRVIRELRVSSELVSQYFVEPVEKSTLLVEFALFCFKWFSYSTGSKLELNNENKKLSRGI